TRLCPSHRGQHLQHRAVLRWRQLRDVRDRRWQVCALWIWRQPGRLVALSQVVSSLGAGEPAHPAPRDERANHVGVCPPMWAGLLCVLLLGCGGESEFPVTQLEDGSVEIDHSGLPQQNLQGELLVSTEIIGDPRYASVVGRQLWISDRAGDPWLHVIDLEADSIVISFGRTGEGPGDFSEVPQLSNRLHDSGGIWAYDARLRRLTRLSTRPDEPVDIRTSLDGSVGHVWSF